MSTHFMYGSSFQTPALPLPRRNADRLPVEQHCEILVLPSLDLSFTVRVTLGGKRFIKGGFANPDEAQWCGIRAMCAMHHAH